jgi:subtilisin
VGGIVAARNNTADVVGVAPDATLYAVKVLDAFGSGTDSTVMAGLDWIQDNWNRVSPPIRVVNMSLGRSGTLDDNPALRQAVQHLYNQGLVVVVSAGNDPAVEVSQQVPATYPEVLAIASTTALGGTSQCRSRSAIAADTASWFTTDGAFNTASGIGVTVSAPGGEKETIAKSCTITSVGILSTKLGGGTTRMSGTSMAAPHVSGVVALMWQRFGSLDPEVARNNLRSSADRVGTAPLDSPASGYSFDGEREGVVWAPGALK